MVSVTKFLLYEFNRDRTGQELFLEEKGNYRIKSSILHDSEK